MDYLFSASTLVKIKAQATDPDGSVAEVQFFVGTNLIGVVTNSPFNLIWPAGANAVIDPVYPQSTLKAVAIDNVGARAESAPLKIGFIFDIPPFPVVEIASPCDGGVLAAPATFVFSAEVLTSIGDSGPVEFFVGTNSVGLAGGGAPLLAETPPSSVTVTNLPEGEYKLTVRYRGGDGIYCTCYFITNTIRVVKLGVQLPSLTPDGVLQFEVVTSFPGRQTVIEASADLRDWVSVSTNLPSSNTFTFTEPSAPTNAQRFYRVLVPP